MKISIISICFNNEKDIRSTIESVVNQTYQDIEYIIVDGSSKDNTLEIVNEYKDKIAKIISEPDKGLYDAINKGIKVATGDVVGLIHASDRLFNNEVIAKIARHFDKNDIEALYGHSKIINAENGVDRINQSPQFKKSLFKQGWFPSHQSFYVKRELFEKYGYYKLKYRIAADYELVFRFLYCYDVKVSLLDEYIVLFSLGGTSTKSWKNIFELNKECAEAWKENGKRIPFYTIPLKLFRKIPQFIKAKF
ncbi:glycosyl transferase [Bacteroidia bacterium]|nr:glycosyl transferase [Bacteroidia bacterium]